MQTVSRSEATRTFARIGLLSFGGPAAQIAVMHRVLVEEKKWLSEEQFLHALNFCMLLPGPEAMQLATYSGWLLHGVRGGLVAGLLFIVPGLVMMLGLSAIYVAFGDVPVLEGIFYGLKAAVIAIVIQALIKVSGKALKFRGAYAIAAIAFVAIFFLRVPFPLIILTALIVGLAMSQLSGVSPSQPAPKAAMTASAAGQSLTALIGWGALWLVPLAGLWFAFPGFPADAAWFFSKTAAVTFGGAYSVLSYVAQHAVTVEGWLSADDMLKGLGLAETTLGPLVLVLVFVGFLGGANAAGGSLLGGLVGGLIAAFFIFVPCFLWIFAGAPHMERLRHAAWLTSALQMVMAAVVGVIANLAVWFAIAVMFGEPAYERFKGVWLPQISWAQTDWLAVGIAAASAIALLRFKIGMMPVLGLAALAGAAMRLL